MMNQDPRSIPASPFRRILRATSLATLASWPIACNGASGPPLNPGGEVGSTQSGGLFLTDPHFAGNSTELRIEEVYWGRMVDVFGQDAGGGAVLMNEDFVIGAGLVSDPFDYELGVNPVTGGEILTIRRDVTDPDGRSQYASLLGAAEANRTPIFDNGPGGSGMFSMVPRNSSIVIRFNDLLDPDLVNRETVRVLVGSPSVEPFEARVLADLNHGGMADRDGDGVAAFYPTRVVVDPAVSEAEAFATSPPLNPNGLGLPASIRVDLSNVEIRIPTRTAPSFGQEEILRNASGHGLSLAANGTADLTSPTRPIVRAMRSGGSAATTADPFNGFLRDDIPPQLIGVLPGFIETVPMQDPADPNVFTIGQLRFSSTACARRPRIGDVLEQPGIFAQVIAAGVPPVNGVTTNVRVRLIMFPSDFSGPGAWSGSALGPVDYLSRYEQVADAGVAPCFVQFSPGAPDLAFPTVDLGVDTTIGLRFSEPMDPTTVTAFDSMTLTRVASSATSGQYVIGQIGRSQDLRNFSFVPGMNLAHQTGLDEEYFFSVRAGSQGPRDLAGNVLPVQFPQVSFRLNPAQATVRNGGRVTRFADPDEDEPIGGDMGPLPEWTGQHFYDLQGEFIRPRPVSRFQAIADRSSAIIGLMNPFPQGVQTPLSPFGCRLMHLYRYVDVGFSITDTTNYNIDVEGLNWAPANGQVTADFFPEYEIRLGHCRHFPDEKIETPSLFPEFPNSGLVPAYQFEILTPEVSPMKVVHPRDRGYSIDPGNAFTTPTGTLMLPWPINTDPSREKLFYTWRDTSIMGRDGGKGDGVDPQIIESVTERQHIYNEDNIQSIGLPLLVEHRCYPAASDALGNNALDIAFAVNSSRRPFFRAFSVGGFAAGGTVVEVEPDLEVRANGGFNPAQAGAPTPGQDPNVYYGALDLVVRVSRSVSLWFEVSDPTGNPFDFPRFDQPIVEPRPQDQPSGTSVDFAFRGAISITDNASFVLGQDPRDSTNYIDSYGNHYAALNDPEVQRDANLANRTITFLTGDEEWLPLNLDAPSNPMGIDGAQYYQIRASFTANPQTSLVPTLSAIALSWD